MLESPSAGLQPAARPSQLPTRSAVPTKRPGVFVTPGLRLRTRDVRGRASRPQGIEPERARRWIGGSLRFLATQGVTRTPGEHGQPRCKGYLRPTRLGADLWPARRLVPLQTRDPGRMFARFRGDDRTCSRKSPSRCSERRRWSSCQVGFTPSIISISRASSILKALIPRNFLAQDPSPFPRWGPHLTPRPRPCGRGSLF